MSVKMTFSPIPNFLVALARDLQSQAYSNNVFAAVRYGNDREESYVLLGNIWTC